MQFLVINTDRFIHSSFIVSIFAFFTRVNSITVVRGNQDIVRGVSRLKCEWRIGGRGVSGGGCRCGTSEYGYTFMSAGDEQHYQCGTPLVTGCSHFIGENINRAHLIQVLITV